MLAVGSTVSTVEVLPPDRHKSPRISNGQEIRQLSYLFAEDLIGPRDLPLDRLKLEVSGSGERLAISDKTKLKVLVLDTSALVMGINPSALDLPTYSVASVMNELIPDTLPYTRFSASQDSGHLKVKEPGGASVRAVEEASSRVGDVGVLSKADLEVLALAFDLKLGGMSPTIVSDDYAIQNVSEALGMEYASLATFGIAKRFDWIYYCPACFKRYKAEDAESACRVCGTRLKRKVSKKEHIQRKILRGPKT